jgi:hypothetical protein
MRFLLSVVLALGIAAAAYGAAASLNVNGGTVQAGSASATCDDNHVTVNYTLDNLGQVDEVIVSDIDAACAGTDVFVTVEDSGNNPIAALSGMAADLMAGDDVTCGPNANVNPANIDEVKVVIANTAATLDTGNCASP